MYIAQFYNIMDKNKIDFESNFIMINTIYIIINTIMSYTFYNEML